MFIYIFKILKYENEDGDILLFLYLVTVNVTFINAIEQLTIIQNILFLLGDRCSGEYLKNFVSAYCRTSRPLSDLIINVAVFLLLLLLFSKLETTLLHIPSSNWFCFSVSYGNSYSTKCKKWQGQTS